MPSLQPIADLAMLDGGSLPKLDGGSLASMRNEPVLAEGRVFVATTPNYNPKTTMTGIRTPATSTFCSQGALAISL